MVARVVPALALLLAACASGRSAAPATPRAGAPAAHAPAATEGLEVGQTAPELPPGGTWLGAPAGGSLAALRGRAVYLQFSFLGCPACRHTWPQLATWQRTYGPQGLAVVMVDNGRMDGLAAVEAEVRSGSLPITVVHDPGGRATDRYGVSSFPDAWILDRSGRVVWKGIPMGDPAPVERAIHDALR